MFEKFRESLADLGWVRCRSELEGAMLCLDDSMSVFD